MGPEDTSTLYGIVGKVWSWIPGRAKSSDASRAFWMPDQSCRVCYDCDSPFTLLNRRHHCRLCGRVFCGRCTGNTIRVEGWNQEDRERSRVCDFCFKLWEQETVKARYNGIPLLSPAISPSPSVQSLARSESSVSSSGNNSDIRSIMPLSTVPYQHITCSSALNPGEANGLEPAMEKNQQYLRYWGRKTANNTYANPVSTMEGTGSVSSAFGIPSCRSDDEDDDYSKIPEDSQWGISRKPEHYSENGSVVCTPFNKVNHDDLSSRNGMDVDKSSMQHILGRSPISPIGVLINHGDLSSRNAMDLSKSSMQHILGRSPSPPIGVLIDSQFPRMRERSGEESEGTDNGNESNDEPSMFEAPSPESEQPMDIENNGSIWIPPEPEDEEDERETSVFDDDDDDYDVGGWGLPPSTGSFSDGEYKSKDRQNEEHRKAMRAVVDGHFRALVAQLLKGEDVPVGEENDRESWLEILTSLAWQAASLVKPDTSKGGVGMDPGKYVKVKCIACGRQSESEVIKGVVCKKNVAHRRMTTRYKNPRILILGGALEYQRVSNTLSSLDTLLQQEMEHLKMTVAKIEAHRPNVLLVEKTVSRHAQDYLLEKEISLVLNIKRPLLERIARCTGAQIVPSVDNLTAPKVGHCESFHVDKVVEEHGSAGQPGRKLLKTLMFFEGCPKPLGCTVLLKGANGDELKKVKRVVQYSVFAAYHLALETSFLADERASLPELPLKSPITVALPDKQSNLDRSISTIPGFMIPSSRQTNTMGMKSFSAGALTQNTLVAQEDPHSVSQNFYSLAPPSGHLRSELSSSLKHTCEAVPSESLRSHEAVAHSFDFENKSLNDYVMDNGLNISASSQASPHCELLLEEKPHELQQKIVENMEHPANSTLIMDQNIVRHENQDTAHSEGQVTSKKDFAPSPSDQQSILVSLSTRCVWKGTICERAHLFRIKYYGSFDKPLGRFLKDDLFDQNYICRHCNAPTQAHVRCYTHQQGSLTISVKHLDETILPGEKEGKIWMWHLCVKCAHKTRNPYPTRRVVMSDAAWGLSFGKFLELSFSNHAAASRAASCGHSLHRDCLRFYGFGRTVACFRYAPIHVLSVHLPPPKLEFNNPTQQEWLRKEASDLEDKGELHFAEVFDSLRQIGEKIASSGSCYAGMKVPEARRLIAQLEGLLQRDKSEFEDLLQKCMAKDCKAGQPVADILELYRLRRLLILKLCAWDKQLWLLDSILRGKRSFDGWHSIIAEELNLLLQKENNNSNLCHKLLETNGIENDKDDACKNIIPMVEKNGHPSNGNIDDNPGGSVKLQNGDVSITSMQGITQPSSIQDCFQLPVVDESLTGDENIDVRKISEFIENHKPLLVRHEGANINSNSKDLSSTTQALTCPLSKDITGNGSNEMLEENQHAAAVNGKHRKDISERDHGVHRSLSEGNFKVVDLSDTLDAAWTGEGQSVVGQAVQITMQGQEVGPAAPAIENAQVDAGYALRSDSFQVEKSVVLPAVKTDSENNGQDKNGPERLSAPTSPVKSTDASEEFGSWIGAPFSVLYKAYSKNSQGSLPGFPLRLNFVSSYVPTFVSSVNQLGDQGAARLFLREGVNNTVIAIYDDEPTSIIAYALTSREYHAHISDKTTDNNKQKEREADNSSFSTDVAPSHPLQASDVSEVSEGILKERSYGSEDNFTSGSKGTGVADPFLYAKAMHVKVSFGDDNPPGKVKYTVTCYYAKQFDTLRKKCCPTEFDFIRSLSRCKKWGAQGGKSNVFFAKTLDDRFIIKQVTKTELESFIKFAPEYFKYLLDSLSTGSPTCLAKILGIYQVTAKHVKGGKEVRMDLMVMENLLYGRKVSRVYDLKGSGRSRYNPDSTGSNKVLLDQNLIESMPTSPIFVGNKAKRLLERAVWNDTSFLASIDVMDYSLLVGVDEERRELVLGIIDFMRQYTWDKHLETWVKASGILGGPKNTSPTVISPKQYKKRFRKAMSTYFLMVPDQWTPPPTAMSCNSQSGFCEDVPTSAQGDGQ